MIGVLTIAASYCAAMWLFTAAQVLLGRIEATSEIERHTFHLGLCFILAVGFLGVLQRIGG